MLIGVPSEVKVHEYRVGLVPAGVRELVHHGHQVIVQSGAGAGIGMFDADYQDAGATIVDDAAEVFAKADMIVKVKEPLAREYTQLSEDQLLFTYLHLAPDAEQTRGLVDSGCTAIAYETVTDAHGRLPLLAPMSEVAGRMSAQVAAHCLEKNQGGKGVLMGGVPGVLPANVVVLGCGVSGMNAARMAMGMQAKVFAIDKSLDKLNEVDLYFGRELDTLYSTVDHIEKAVEAADVVIGCVLVPGAAAPKLVTHDMVRKMRPGSVMVDVAIDQGGCFETSRPTTHDAPTYVVDDVVHYCVTNMPGAVARTSTFALTNATMRFVLALADKGVKRALGEDPHLMNGLNVHKGQVTYKAVADNLGYDFVPPQQALGF
ncbi:alanine dehydrogenase [Rhodovibrio sodomensis]|uniref:Alanine dehydrogenase n=1 Tax=Rhodovibrio sodomensis TaxID=1088 RepID=A0ABS1D930_9PROT|nr:alanine dehydrogenase [Rhodovibrio sodomensis]MBK1666880.1 alanine dehydrogenase [Rhodovibrio sodomensis]